MPQHGFLLSGHCERQVGALCGYGCMLGYRLTAGDSLHECQSNGTWSGHPLTCEGMKNQPQCMIGIHSLEIHCLPLKTDSQVFQECSPKPNSTGATVGTRCRARCNESAHRLLGPSTRECLIVGRWSGYDQFCIGKQREHRLRKNGWPVSVNNKTGALVVTNTTSTSPSTTTTVPAYRGKELEVISVAHDVLAFDKIIQI